MLMRRSPHGGIQFGDPVSSISFLRTLLDDVIGLRSANILGWKLLGSGGFLRFPKGGLFCSEQSSWCLSEV